MIFLQMLGVFIGGLVACISIGMPNNSKKIAVLFFGFVMAIICGSSLYQAENEKLKSIERLSRFGSYIDWSKSSIVFEEAYSDKNYSNISYSAQIKFISRTESVLGRDIDIKKIITSAQPVHAYDFMDLTNDDAQALFFSHSDEKNQSIVVADETNSNIYTLQFYLKEMTKVQGDRLSYSLDYEYGANARSGFRSLFDINDSFVLLRLSSNKNIKPSILKLTLKTNLGDDILFFSINSKRLHTKNTKSLTLGVYVPNNYWLLESK